MTPQVGEEPARRWERSPHLAVVALTIPEPGGCQGVERMRWELKKLADGTQVREQAEPGTTLRGGTRRRCILRHAGGERLRGVSEKLSGTLTGMSIGIRMGAASI